MDLWGVGGSEKKRTIDKVVETWSSIGGPKPEI